MAMRFGPPPRRLSFFSSAPAPPPPLAVVAAVAVAVAARPLFLPSLACAFAAASNMHREQNNFTGNTVARRNVTSFGFLLLLFACNVLGVRCIRIHHFHVRLQGGCSR